MWVWVWVYVCMGMGLGVGVYIRQIIESNIIIIKLLNICILMLFTKCIKC